MSDLRLILSNNLFFISCLAEGLKYGFISSIYISSFTSWGFELEKTDSIFAEHLVCFKHSLIYNFISSEYPKLRSFLGSIFGYLFKILKI
jgi:hypothetical protein